MTYDVIVTTNEGKHTYQNIEAKNEQHLTDKIRKDLKTEIVEIGISKTFGEEFNYD
ncbi:hypothetical protein ACNNMU_01185 [Aerococcus viridans]